MNVVLSLAFASVVLYGLDFIGYLSFTLGRLALVGGALVVLTYLVTR
jgi:hypothetical protein